MIIGAGMASGRMLEHLFEAAPFAYAVTLFNAEPPGNYNRLLLSPVLSGEKTYAEIVTHDEDWYEAQGVTTRFGGQVSAFRPVQTATRLKVTGVDLFCAGDFADAPGREDIIFRDPGRGIYKRLVIAGDKLLSVKKADLPSIWADLNAAGMVSGHACSKGLRTVKTCVGTEFCRFGTQDSTGLGIRLEKLLWGLWTPAKVKLGVSGCPRNCAVATCKDVGVVCVDSGFEISVAGAAGMDVKETEPLRKVTTEAEVLETVAAFVQLYRENAR